MENILSVKDLNVYYDDGIQHIARAYATYLSIIHGEHTEVLSNLANGFGYSWDLFYGNFSKILNTYVVKTRRRCYNI